MDFYKELLESFSRIKGRKLRLLEGEELDPEAVALATQAKAQGAKQPGMKAGEARPIETPGGGLPVIVWVTQDDVKKIVFKIGDGYAQGVDANWEAFVSAFTEEGSQDSGERKKRGASKSTASTFVDPGLEVLDQYPVDEETKTKVAGLYTKITGMAEKIYNSWMFQLKKGSREFIEGDADEFAKSPATFRNYLVGASRQSFQQKLVAPKSSLLFEGGVWEKQDYSLDAVQLAGITESYHDLLNLISNDRVKCDSLTQQKVLEKFSKTPNGNVIIKPKTGDKNQALSFADDTGQMKNLLDMVELKCPNMKVREEVIKAPLGGGGSDNAVRGLGFEKILELVSLISMNKEKPNDRLQALINFKISELTRKLQTLRSVVERWVDDSKLSAMDPEDLEIAGDIIKMLKGKMIGASEGSVGQQAESLFTRMLEHSKEAMRVRRPLVFLPVGDQVGGGKRQDILEIYSSAEEAVAAAARSGIKIDKKDIKCGPAKNFFIGGKGQGNDQATLTALEGAGKLNRNQSVCTLKVSLKNYMSLDWAKYGGGRYSTFKGLMTGKNDDFLNSIAANLRIPVPQEETLDANGDPIPTELDELKTYAAEMDSLGKEVFDIPLEAATIDANGNPIKVPSGELTAKALIDTLRQKSSYDEFTGSSDALRIILNTPEEDRTPEQVATLAEVEAAPEKENDIDDLIRQAEVVAGGTGITKKEKSLGFERLQLLLNDRFQALRVRKDIAAGDKKGATEAQKKRAKQAKRFTAAKMYHSGGSDDNDLICDYRDLLKNETYIFKQNEPLNDAWGSVLSGGADKNGRVWDMKIEDSGLVTLRSGDMTLRLKSDVKSTKNSAGQPTGSQQTLITEVDRSVMVAYKKNKGPKLKKKSKKEESTLESVMDTLLEVIGALKGKISVSDLQKII
tara:strand:+ start:98 stop:2821 length:2724 start_codon:yes stop_codon:yes gene_type:complete